MSNLAFGSDDFLNIIDLYYDKENFNINSEIFKTLHRFCEEIKESSYEDYSKIFQIYHQNKEEVKYFIDMEHLVKIYLKII